MSGGELQNWTTLLFMYAFAMASCGALAMHFEDVQKTSWPRGLRCTADVPLPQCL